MMIQDLISKLRADLDEPACAALTQAADGLAARVRQAFSTPPGGPHDHPWLRTGALHDSVGHQSEGPQAFVGSSAPAAVFQEHGTATIPPRPTFGPLAAEHGAAIARRVAVAVVEALRQH